MTSLYQKMHDKYGYHPTQQPVMHQASAFDVRHGGQHTIAFYNSIETHGILMPVLAANVGSGLIIIDGKKRVAAAQALSLVYRSAMQVPTIVYDTSYLSMAIVDLVEWKSSMFTRYDYMKLCWELMSDYDATEIAVIAGRGDGDWYANVMAVPYEMRPAVLERKIGISAITRYLKSKFEVKEEVDRMLKRGLRVSDADIAEINKRFSPRFDLTANLPADGNLEKLLASMSPTQLLQMQKIGGIPHFIRKAANDELAKLDEECNCHPLADRICSYCRSLIEDEDDIPFM